PRRDLLRRRHRPVLPVLREALLLFDLPSGLRVQPQGVGEGLRGIHDEAVSVRADAGGATAGRSAGLAAGALVSEAQTIAIASISIIQSGCASWLISTSVEAHTFFPRNSSRSGARSARWRMSVRYVVIFTTFAIVPPCDSTSFLMHSKAPRACALKSPRCAGLPSVSYATWPERKRIVCAPVTFTPWLYVAGSNTPGAQNFSMVGMVHIIDVCPGLI